MGQVVAIINVIWTVGLSLWVLYLNGETKNLCRYVARLACKLEALQEKLTKTSPKKKTTKKGEK